MAVAHQKASKVANHVQGQLESRLRRRTSARPATATIASAGPHDRSVPVPRVVDESWVKSKLNPLTAAATAASEFAAKLGISSAFDNLKPVLPP